MDMDPKVRKLQDERMMWIGWVCCQWSFLEYILLRGIGKMAGIEDEETRKVLFGGLDMRPRLAMAAELAVRTKAPIALREALADASRAIEGGLLKRRNRAVHGVQFIYADGDMDVEIHRGKDRSRRRLTATDLCELTKEIEAVTLSLNRAMNVALWGAESKPYTLLEKPAPQPRKRSSPTRDQSSKPREPRRQSSSE